MRVAICGGTFDPFHRGHLEPVLAVKEELGWDRVWYMPANRQPFKTTQRTASGFDRFAMCTLATRAHDDIEISDWELERPQVSYTVDTLEHLRKGSDATFEWVIGDDNLAKLLEWRSLGRILELANFVVLSRGGATVPAELAERVVPAEQRGSAGSIVFARNDTVPVSSTEIRASVAEGRPIDGLVDADVARYIHKRALYRNS